MTSLQLRPGTRIGGSDVFDLHMSARGYRINKMCNALSQAANRDAFKRDEEAFLAAYHLTEEEKQLIARLGELQPGVPAAEKGGKGFWAKMRETLGA